MDKAITLIFQHKPNTTDCLTHVHGYLYNMRARILLQHTHVMGKILMGTLIHVTGITNITHECCTRCQVALAIILF